MILIWYLLSEEGGEKMNKLLIAGAITALIIGGSVSYSAAECSLSHVSDNADGKIVNDRCPVMGNKVGSDTPYKTAYEGKTIGFCCASCVDSFNKNPEKYEANLKDVLKEKTS